MDILFSPYGVGTMPKSTMEEIEQKTEDLLRSSSFQQMLELEKKYKMERLQETAIPSLPASPTAAGFSDTHHAPPPQQHQYADSLAQQQKFLMLKAARGHVSLPLLSIKIPHKGKEEEVDAVTPTNAESFHKQVKFLAPEDNEDEDAMSEQSSICHSPSWENYGQKKKEKKLEAERRKKEKAQAEKEAKAAKKRSSSRLSKIQPSSTASINRDPRASTALVHSERSMSDPSFLAQHLTHGQEEYGRSASANNLQQHVGQYPPVVSDLLNNADPRFPLRRSMSEGPVLPHQPASQSHASNPRPPSASRTPMLRHMSPSRHGRSSSANILQTSGSDRSQEYLRPSSGADTGRREGYVRQQRAQSTEQALAGLADDELLEDHSTDSVSRGPARNVWPVRRSSLTQEARLAAMKLVTGRATPPAKDNDSDYFAFSAHPYSSYDADTPAPIAVEKLPGTSQKAQPVQEMASERPHTSQSSSAGSIMSTQSKKSRNLKDAAKAVLSISNGTKSPSTVKLPPYYAIRARLQSRPTTYAESNTSSSGTSVPPPDTALLTQNSSSDISKASEVIKQPSSQISEGSSSSSACEDGSPLQSPTTTPDTSRPQSMKDVPFAETELIKSTPNAGDLQDDQRTLRESLDSSNSTTPRLDDSAASQSAKMSSEDKWSRTELPIDPDCDAQSFKTSRSTLDDLGDISMTQPSLAPEPQFTSQLAPEADDVAVQTDPVISIPPRSKRRTQSVSSHIQLSPSTPEDGTSQEPKPRPEKANRKQKRQLRLQEPEELVSSASSTVISSGSTSPTGGIPTLSAEFRIPSNPYVEEYPEVTTSPHHHTIEHSRTFAASSSSVSLPSSRSQSISSKPTAPPRTNSAPVLSSVTPIATSRPTKLAPVSILKQPKNSTEGPSPPLSPGRGAPVLSALPKHMQQLQKDVRQQPPPLPSTTGGSPVAKMFVECCSCKFYHDMPSKIYECMAKPDAVVEDRTLGISGAITTMVKCPWCNHNMSTKCCAGYAAVVYLKEKLH